MRIPSILRGRGIIIGVLEGNGQSPPEIIELALLPLAGDAAEVEGIRSWLIRPALPITPIVTKRVHGISNADVLTAPPWSEVADEIEVALGDRILLAHNADGDRRVISAHLPEWRPEMVIDTVRLAKAVWPDLYGGYSLEDLVRHAQLDRHAIPGQRQHRAAWDTWATWQLLARLVEDSGYGWDQLVRASALNWGIAAPEPAGLW
ncbi:3'-5' exonuclease [Nocardia salmonicida]|uniref:3'-5' exonuclease n=1 Tax=Nocardia salmonicida TaxID=53431 RepID=UPI0007A4CD4F|nr:3'-5' exonuclease [Nocardia salmonicida]